MTLPVQLLRDKVITNYYLYQTGKSAEVGGQGQGKEEEKVLKRNTVVNHMPKVDKKS